MESDREMQRVKERGKREKRGGDEEMKSKKRGGESSHSQTKHPERPKTWKDTRHRRETTQCKLEKLDSLRVAQ